MNLRLTCVYHVKIKRNNKIIVDKKVNNIVTQSGAESLINYIYFTGTRPADFRLGLISALGTSAPSTDSGDTLASKAWDELLGYTQSIRPQWLTLPSAAIVSSVARVDSSTPAIFNINTPDFLGGFFLAEESVKGGTTGLLISAGAFQTADLVELIPGDIVELSYSFGIEFNASIGTSGYAAGGAKAFVEAYILGGSIPQHNGYFIFSSFTAGETLAPWDIYTTFTATSLNITSGLSFDSENLIYSFTATISYLNVSQDMPNVRGAVLAPSPTGTFIAYIALFKDINFLDIRVDENMTINFTVGIALA